MDPPIGRVRTETLSWMQLDAEMLSTPPRAERKVPSLVVAVLLSSLLLAPAAAAILLRNDSSSTANYSWQLESFNGVFIVGASAALGDVDDVVVYDSQEGPPALFNQGAPVPEPSPLALFGALVAAAAALQLRRLR